MHMNLDPPINKVVLIALLLFAEGIAIPTYTVISSNRWPTPIEFAGFFLSAFIQLLTFFVTFLKTGDAPLNPPPPTQQIQPPTTNAKLCLSRYKRRLMFLAYRK